MLDIIDLARNGNYALGMILHQQIPDDLHRALKVEAARRGITLKELVVELLAKVAESTVKR